MISWLLILALQLPLSPAAKAAINAPYARMGRTYQSLESAFGPQVRRFDVEAFQTPHADIPGAKYTVDYGGIVVTFLSSPGASDVLITALEVTDMRWLPVLGVTLEEDRTSVERRLGRALKSDAATLHYEDEEGSDIGPTTLTLSFRDNKLVRAVWAFPWD